MILVDAGPLVAMIDADDHWHEVCSNAGHVVGRTLTTTWPVVAESMYILGDRIGWPAQQRLWILLRRGVEIIAPDAAMVARTEELMDKYSDLPMDIADASLVALAEARGIDRIFTLDRHFRVYRVHGRRHFRLIP